MSESYVSADFIIKKVLDDMEIDDISKYRSSIYEWIYNAELLINTLDGSLQREECVLDIDNFRAKLPRDFYKLAGPPNVDGHTAQYNGRDFRFFYKKSNQLADRSLRDEFPYEGEYKDNKISSHVYTIDSKYIHVNKKSGTLGIAYYKSPIDDSGCPYIHKGHEEAISHYVQYKIARRLYTSGKLNRGVYMDLKREWEFRALQAYTQDEWPSDAELDYASMLWNSHGIPGDTNAI